MAAQDVEPEALVVTHLFDPGERGAPYSATVRLTGRRVGANGAPAPADTFVQEDQLEGVVPGSGPMSITSWIYGLEPGEWSVHAEALRSDRSHGTSPRTGPAPLPRASWSFRRWALSAGPAEAIKTRWALVVPLARLPGVIPGSWTVLGIVAAIVAVATQAAIVGHDGGPVSQSLIVTLTALLAGLLGAKVWYAVLHPAPGLKAILGGWAVDGFLVVAPIVAIATLVAINQPVGPYLDSAAPGLFFGVAIGRIGCFFTGCCAGRMTSSRWGLWSCDRDTRIGARRIPAQLLESGAGLAIGIGASATVVFHVPRPDGAVFVVAFIAYLITRQVLLRVRAEARQFSWRRRAAAPGRL